MPSSRGSSWLRNRTCISCVSCIAEGFFIHWATWDDVLTTLYFSEEPPKHSLFLLPQKNHTFLRLECLCYCRQTDPHILYCFWLQFSDWATFQQCNYSPDSQLGCWDFSSSQTSSFGRLGLVHVLHYPIITDTQKQWEREHQSGELNSGLWKLEIQLKWEAISSAPLVNIIKWRSYNLWISVEREAVECSRLSGKGIVFENEGLMQDEEQKVQAFYVWPELSSFSSQSSWRDEISSGRKGTDMQSAEADRASETKKKKKCSLG